MSPESRHRLAMRLGVTGAALGIAAGLVQVVAGHQIPEWTGAKLATTPLGLLTVGLSLLAGLAARRQRDSDLSVLARAACALGLIGPGLVCLSTVGRLWYLPAVLLVVAGGLTIDSWRQTASVLAENWYRVLLSVTGASQMLMAAGASPALLVIGGIGGILVIVAAWLRTPHPAVLVVGLVAVGTVPFATLGWTALVPVLVAAQAGALTALVVRDSRRAQLTRVAL